MQSQSEFSNDDRYGVRSRRGWVVGAAVFALFGITWLLWASLHHSRPELSSTLISFSSNSDREISIRYSLHRRDATREVICTLIARDIDKSVVGQIDDLIESGLATIDRTIIIPTRNTAVNADVLRCRLV